MTNIFKIVNNKLETELPKMSKKQTYILQNLSTPSELISYLQTFKGIRKTINNKYVFPRMIPDKLSTKIPAENILKLHKMCDGNRTFSPVLGDFYFGVEIECFIPRYSDSASYCERCYENSDDECNCGYESNDKIRSRFLKYLKENRIKNVSIKNDSSINCDGEYWPVEFTVLINSNDWTNLSKLCQLLNYQDAKVNKSCGLHVHLDSRGLDPVLVRSKAKKLGKALNILKFMVPESRRLNTFCKLGVSRMNGERYYAVNLTSYKKYKTIEIRLHSGTTNFNKIQEWCTILKSIFDANLKSFPKVIREVNDFSGILSERSMEYVQQRIDFFNNQTVKVEITDTDYQEAS